MSNKSPGDVDHTLNSPDVEPHPPGWRDEEGKATPGDGGVEMLRKTAGQRELGLEERVWKLWPGAVTESGCQETYPEDRCICQSSCRGWTRKKR